MRTAAMQIEFADLVRHDYVHTDEFAIVYGGSAFGLQVYERARDELKPKHKDAFDVAAIVEILACTNGQGTNLSCP